MAGAGILNTSDHAKLKISPRFCFFYVEMGKIYYQPGLQGEYFWLEERDRNKAGSSEEETHPNNRSPFRFVIGFDYNCSRSKFSISGSEINIYIDV